MTEVDEAFSIYRQTVPTRDPDLARKLFDDELRQISVVEGLRDFSVAPALDVVAGAPPISRDTPTP
jgi:hypothetical protein